jgi:hypothetical protein
MTYRFIDPIPPRHFVIAAGMAGSGYDNFARYYARILARDGVQLEVRNAAGAVEDRQQLGWNLQADRLSHLEVDHQFKISRLLKAARVESSPHKFASAIDYRQRVECRQLEACDLAHCMGA